VKAKVENLLLKYRLKEADEKIKDLTKYLHEERERYQRLMGEKLAIGDAIRNQIRTLREDIFALKNRMEEKGDLIE
jgi:predicted  nucleic acid-binding Zn-ribbon protein